MSRQASIGVSAPRPGSKTPGYSNLLSHTRQKHPDFEAIMVASDTGSETLVDTKSQALYCWIDWTVLCNLPFSFPDNTIVHKYHGICTETLIKYIGLLTTEVEQIVISVLLPNHRRNSAVKSYLASYEPLLSKSKTTMRPVYRNATGWSSTFAMTTRFFALKEFINTEADKIAALIPSRREETQLKSLLEGLKDFGSASLKLQSIKGVSLLDVRDLFDALIDQYPSLSDCLSATQPSCKTQSSRLPVYLLCAARASHCLPDNAACFNLLNRGTEATESVTAMSFAERVLKRSKEECQGRIEIPLLPFIPPISNCVKRFFSRAKHLLFHHHSRMLPIHLEMLLFLNENRHFWTANTLFHPLVATFALLSFGTLAKVQEETKSIDDLYAEAVAEGGKLVLYHGGDTPTQQDSLHEDFQQRFQEINFTLVVDYSKYHDVRIDNQLETDTLVPDVVALQTLQDFTRWADEGKLLQYKPKWFSHIHASLKDNDGAWMAYTVYSFYTSYNSSSLDGLDAPATLENLTDSQWAGKIASSYPNDDDAVLYLSSNT
ncbi:hypothetical protein PC119_g17113 [Phytophthora cactorum]|nr:hypothetical protein PC119_g17113 [Phytophthora cactorum]